MTDMRTTSEIEGWQVWATIGVLLLGAAGTLLGLFREGFYKDPYALQLQGYGQDMVTLGVVLPVLTVGLWYGRRGSQRSYFLWLGALGYMAYTYLVYAVITEFHWFFLGYVALFGLSIYTFGAGLLQIDAESVQQQLTPQLPRRLIAGFFAAMGVMVGILWLSEVVPASLRNTKPASVAAFGLPANVIHVVDLAVVIPAMFITARWLLQGRPWGFVLPGVLLVKVVTISLAVLGMIAWMITHGEPVTAVEIAVFSLLTIAGIAVGVVYFRSFQTTESTNEDPSQVAVGD